MNLPAKVNHQLVVASVHEFLDDPDWQARVAEYGWNILLKGESTLLVTLSAKPVGNTAETFMLRLICDYCPTYPPDVQFVNPVTHAYVPGQDQRHVADLRAPYCHVHLNYSYQNPYPYGPQLVCSSMTLGYYASNHVPIPEQAWQPGRHSIGASIYTVHRALHSSYYFGRQSG